MTKSPPHEIEEHKDGEKRRDQALANALAMPPAPFTPKAKVAPNKKKTTR